MQRLFSVVTMGGNHALYVTAVPLSTSIRSSTLWAMPSGKCNTLLMGASTGLPPSASTLRAGTGALAGPGICNMLDLTDGALGSATFLLQRPAPACRMALGALALACRA